MYDYALLSLHLPFPQRKPWAPDPHYELWLAATVHHAHHLLPKPAHLWKVLEVQS